MYIYIYICCVRACVCVCVCVHGAQFGNFLQPTQFI